MPEDPYVYPGTHVLRNRFGVRHADELARREHDASSAQILALLAERLPGRYDVAHLQAFHRQIFGDVYEWAGELRTVAIAKADLFALPVHIEPYLSGVLAQLPGEQFLKGLPADRLADRLTYYLAEINAAHPFREGNGRTQRAFIGQLAADAGHTIAWEQLTPERNIETAVAAMRGDSAPLRQALGEIITPAAKGGRDLRAASFPAPAAHAVRRQATQPQRPAARRSGRSPGVER